MFAGQRKRNCFANAASNQFEAGTFNATKLHVLRADVGRTLDAESQHLAVEVAAKLRYIFVVGVQHGGPAGVQALDPLILRARALGPGLEKLQMRPSDTVPHRTTLLP